MRVLTLTIVSGVLGCSEPEETGSGLEAVPQLESIDTFSLLDDEELDEYGVGAAGTLRVTGDERDYKIRVENLEIELHSPGMSDMTANSSELATVNVAPTDWLGWPRSISVTAAAGIIYVADVGVDGSFIEAALSRTSAVVELGNELDQEEDDTWVTTFYTLIVHGDDDDVELTPGDVATLQFKGSTWRAVAVAAYTRELVDGADAPVCPMPTEMVSYELLRVPKAEEPFSLERESGEDMAELTCRN